MTPCSFVTIKSIESIIFIYSSTHLFSNTVAWNYNTTLCIYNFITSCYFVTVKSIESVISIYSSNNCVENQRKLYRAEKLV